MHTSRQQEAMEETAPPSGLSPDDAFGLVAEETRLEILRTLATEDEPLSFSELFDRSEYDTSANFSYHLEKLEGHFISRTEAGYILRQTGQRIVEAIISGTLTEDPVIERMVTGRECPFCSAPVEVSYQQERLEMYCPSCPGLVDPETKDHFAEEHGTLGSIALPPAGLRGRSPSEMLAAADVWTNIDILANSVGVCARCSGSIEQSVTVCENHDATDGTCGECGRRYQLLFKVTCVSCHYEEVGIAIICLLGTTELLAYLTAHGLNPLDPDSREQAEGSWANYEEELVSIDPLRATITYTFAGDAISLTIDEDVSVLDVSRKRVAGAD